MIFAPDTELSLQYAAALVNSRPAPECPETLSTVADLLAHMEGWNWTGAMPETDDDVAQVRRVRDRLRSVWDADLEESVAIVNGLLRDGAALPQLVIHEPFGWHIHATESDAPVAVRIAVDSAMALVDVLRTDARDRLRLCEGEGCPKVLVDLTKNKSRKFCDVTCANRAHAAAYRARQRQEKGDG
jgi:predicted RNA-binding Zn ribbon-like protein